MGWFSGGSQSPEIGMIGTVTSGMARACPKCGYDVSATIDAGIHRCPECGAGFVVELRFPVKGGYLVRLRPDEKRVSGRWLMVALFVLLGIILVITVVYGRRGLAP